MGPVCAHPAAEVTPVRTAAGFWALVGTHLLSSASVQFDMLLKIHELFRAS